MEIDKKIICENCGWNWNESETESHDKYVCHKCGHDNTPVEKLEDGGMVSNERLKYLLGDKGIVPAIGEEHGERVENGISIYKSKPGSYRYVIYEYGVPVSAIQLMSRDGKSAILANAYTIEEKRGRGIGKLLYQKAKEHFTRIDFSNDRSAQGEWFVQSIKKGSFEAGGMLDDYAKWKRANVTYRGVRELGLPNSGASGVLGRGLYTAPSSNKAMAKEYGGIYFIVNARPKNPKVFNTMNHWEIWCQRVLYTKYSKGEFPDLREFNKHSTIEKEMLALGYDGIEIKGREMVNYTPPENVKYFKSEADLKTYYEAIPKLGEGGLIGNIYTHISYIVNIGGEDWADTEYVGDGLEEAKSEYDSISSSDFGSKANSRSNYKELLKYEKRYKFVGDIGEDESIDDYIDNDFLKDDKYWELIEEKDSEQLESDSVERVNEKADELLYEVQSHFDTYGGYKTIYLDEDETISLKLRIKNHSGKHKNKGLEEYFLSIVISDQDPTRYFKTQGPEGISSDEEFEFSSESNKDEIIEFINDKIKEFQEHAGINGYSVKFGEGGNLADGEVSKSSPRVYYSVGLEGYLVGKSRNPYIGHEKEIKCIDKNIRCFVSDSTYRFVYVIGKKNVSVIEFETFGGRWMLMNMFTLENYRRRGYAVKLYNEAKKHIDNISFSKNLNDMSRGFMQRVGGKYESGGGITSIIENTIKKFGMPPGGDNGINAGSCDRFAYEIKKQIPEAKIFSDFDFKELAEDDAKDNGGATLSVYDYSKKVPHGFHFPQFGHCWIYYNGKHYDAELPDGSGDMFDIPVWKIALEEYVNSLKEHGGGVGIFYRAEASTEFQTEKIFKPNGYYEKVGKDNSPVFVGTDWGTSKIAETAASKTLIGAVLGAGSMSGKFGNDKLKAGSKIQIYTISETPDVDISHWLDADFEEIKEVRYRKTVTGKRAFEITLSEESVNLINGFYDIKAFENDRKYDEELEFPMDAEFVYGLMEENKFLPTLYKSLVKNNSKLKTTVAKFKDGGAVEDRQNLVDELGRNRAEWAIKKNSGELLSVEKAKELLFNWTREEKLAFSKQLNSDIDEIGKKLSALPKEVLSNIAEYSSKKEPDYIPKTTWASGYDYHSKGELSNRGFEDANLAIPIVTEKDYHIATDGLFEKITLGEYDGIDAKEYKSESGSAYRTNGGVVYRKSDHWRNQASSNWRLKDSVGGVEYGKISLSELKRNRLAVARSIDNPQSLAEEYYHAKNWNKNPELVKAVEKLLPEKFDMGGGLFHGSTYSFNKFSDERVGDGNVDSNKNWDDTSAGVLIVCEKTGRCLLAFRNWLTSQGSTWGIVSGAVEDGEDVVKSVIRETEDETGYKITTPLYLSDVRTGNGKTFLTYIAIVDNEFTPSLNWEHDEHVWADINNLPSPLHWGVKEFFDSGEIAAEIEKAKLFKQKFEDGGNVNMDKVLLQMKRHKIGDIIDNSQLYQYIDALHDYDFENDFILGYIQKYSKFKLVVLPIKNIDLSSTSQSLVDDYLAIYKETKWYPPILFDVDDDIIVDGYHRATMAHKAGESSVLAWVGLGTMEDGGRFTKNNSQYLQIKKQAHGIIEGSGTIKRLSQYEERGRIKGGARNVEATIVCERIKGAGDYIEQSILQQQELEKYAKAEGIWYNYAENPFEEVFGEFYDRGSEAKLYSKFDGFIIKAIDLYYSANPLDFLDRISLHNHLFPQTYYEVIGFGKNEDAEFVVIVKQPQIVSNKKATIAEIKAELHKRGFTHHRRNDYYNDDYILDDMSSDNVLIDSFGNYQFIDTRLSLNTKDFNLDGVREIGREVFAGGGSIGKKTLVIIHVDDDERSDVFNRLLKEIPEYAKGFDRVINVKNDSSTKLWPELKDYEQQEWTWGFDPTQYLEADLPKIDYIPTTGNGYSIIEPWMRNLPKDSKYVLVGGERDRCIVDVEEIFKHLGLDFSVNKHLTFCADVCPEEMEDGGSIKSLSAYIKNYKRFKSLPKKEFDAESKIKIDRLLGYISFLNTQTPVTITDKLMPVYFGQIINAMVLDLYFHELLKKHGREIIKHIGELPEITDKMNDEKKMSIVKSEFNRLNDRSHSVRANWFFMDSIPEIGAMMSDEKYSDGGVAKYLLAPNGRRSNLNEQQWHLVRTTEFIRFFGDWINSPQNASKVVDENGEPLVVYHASAEQFSVFDTRKSDLFGWHFGDKASAEEVGKLLGWHFGNKIDVNHTVNGYFLNIRTPYEIMDTKDHKKPSRLKGQIHTFFDDFEIDKDKLSKTDRSGRFVVDGKVDYYKNKIQNNKRFDGFVYANRYEGNRKSLSWIANKPEQIKLADGNNITFSSKNSDVRYADGGELYSIAKFEKLSDNIFCVTTKAQEDLVRIFCRFNVYYDNHEFKGKIFTLDEFKKWYSKDTGEFTYYTDYKGFNVPETVFEVFFNGDFDPLSADEQWLSNNIKQAVSTKPYYVIGYVDVEGQEPTLLHELGHAFYYLHKEYKKEVDGVINRLNKEVDDTVLENIHEFLTNLKYDKSIWDDELHAYLISGKPYLIEKGAWSDGLQKYSDEIKSIFDKWHAKLSTPKLVDGGKIAHYEKLPSADNMAHPFDVVYKEYPKILEDGIHHELFHLKWQLTDSKTYSKKEKDAKFDFIDRLPERVPIEIKKVLLTEINQSQFGEDYLNESSKAEAKEYEDIVNDNIYTGKMEDQIRKEDFYPILVNKRNGEILDGNHRHCALTLIGAKYAWVLYVDVPVTWSDAIKLARGGGLDDNLFIADIVDDVLEKEGHILRTETRQLLDGSFEARVDSYNSVFNDVGINIKLKKYIGGGDYGEAYETERGTVCKIAMFGKGEAFLSLKIKKEQEKLASQVKIYGVYKVIAGNESFYVIEKEMAVDFSKYIDGLNLGAESVKDIWRVLGIISTQFDSGIGNKRILNYVKSKPIYNDFIQTHGSEIIDRLILDYMEFLGRLNSDRKIIEERLEDVKYNNIGYVGDKIYCFDCGNAASYKFAKGGNILANQEQVYEKWKDLVNMSASELEKFYDSEEGKIAGLTPEKAKEHGIHYGRESAQWIIKMKKTPVDEWTPKMWEWAKRQNSFISRMRGNKGELYDKNGNRTRKHTSLLIWGHDPEKYSAGGTIGKVLLAPNGKPSNLNATQHALVRSKEFIEWFGNWERAYKIAGLNFLHTAWNGVSKVVDSNGEPKPMFHYNAKNLNGERFNVFATKNRELGSHFGTWRQVEPMIKQKAEGHHRDYVMTDDRIYNVFLGIKNPVRCTDNGYFDAEVLAGGLLKMLPHLKEQIQEVYTIAKDIHKGDKVTGRSNDKVAEDLALKIAKENGIDGIVYLNRYESDKLEFDLNSGIRDTASDEEMLKISPNLEDSYIAFEPNQIKLATGENTTFNVKNPDIRYQEGGSFHVSHTEVDFMGIKFMNTFGVSEDDFSKAIFSYLHSKSLLEKDNIVGNKALSELQTSLGDKFNPLLDYVKAMFKEKHIYETGGNVGITAEDMLMQAATKKKLNDLGDQKEIDDWVERFHAKTKNYEPDTYYRVNGVTRGSGVGRGLYLGRDKQSLINFYDIDGQGFKVRKFIGKPNWLDLVEDNRYSKFEKEAVKKFPVEYKDGQSTQDSVAESIKKLAIEKGYDGVRYYDPFATGEEFVLYDISKVNEVKSEEDGGVFAIEKRKKREYLPEDFVPTDWKAVEPYYIEQLNRKISSVDELKKWLRDSSEIDAAIREYSSRAGIAVTVDTTDEKAKADYESLLDMGELMELPAYLWCKKFIGCEFTSQLGDEFFTTIRDTKNSLAVYCEKNNPIEKELGLMESSYDEISGAQSIDYKGEEITFAQCGVYLSDTNRAEREEVYNKIADRSLEDSEALDELLTDLIKKRHQIAVNAGFKNYVDYLFSGDGDYTAKDCIAFHAVIEETVMPLAHAITAERKERLGVDVLKPWDTGVDMNGGEPLKPFNSADELVEKTITCLNRIDTYFGECISTMNSVKHLDIESRINKGTGGYSTSLYETGIPFILMNSANQEGDVVVMVHEAGHAIHEFLMNDLELVSFKNIPSEIAEVASISMELMTMEHWDVFYKNAEDFSRAKKNQLEGVVYSLLLYCLGDAFQFWLYENPGHTVRERRDKWVELGDKFSSKIIDYTGCEKFREIDYQSFSHFFQNPFYFIEYAFAQLCSLSLWKNFKQNPEKTVSEYKKALSTGSIKTAPQFYEMLGAKFDFTKEYVSELISFLDGELNKYSKKQVFKHGGEMIIKDKYERIKSKNFEARLLATEEIKDAESFVTKLSKTEYAPRIGAFDAKGKLVGVVAVEMGAGLYRFTIVASNANIEKGVANELLRFAIRDFSKEKENGEIIEMYSECVHDKLLTSFKKLGFEMYIAEEPNCHTARAEDPIIKFEAGGQVFENYEPYLKWVAEGKKDAATTGENSEFSYGVQEHKKWMDDTKNMPSGEQEAIGDFKVGDIVWDKDRFPRKLKTIYFRGKLLKCFLEHYKWEVDFDSLIKAKGVSKMETGGATNIDRRSYPISASASAELANVLREDPIQYKVAVKDLYVGKIAEVYLDKNKKELFKGIITDISPLSEGETAVVNLAGVDKFTGTTKGVMLEAFEDDPYWGDKFLKRIGRENDTDDMLESGGDVVGDTDGDIAGKSLNDLDFEGTWNAWDEQTRRDMIAVINVDFGPDDWLNIPPLTEDEVTQLVGMSYDEIPGMYQNGIDAYIFSIAEKRLTDSKKKKEDGGGVDEYGSAEWLAERIKVDGQVLGDFDISAVPQHQKFDLAVKIAAYPIGGLRYNFVDKDSVPVIPEDAYWLRIYDSSLTHRQNKELFEILNELGKKVDTAVRTKGLRYIDFEEGGAITLYHGSKSKFDEFDEDKISSGESADLFGKGFYLTDSKKVADFYAHQVAKKDFVKEYRPTGIFGTEEPVYLPNAEENAEKNKQLNEFKVTGKILDAENFIIDDKFKDYIVAIYAKEYPGFGAQSAERVFEFLKNNKEKIDHYRGELEYIIHQVGMGNKDLVNGIIQYIKDLGYDGVKYPSDDTYEGEGAYNYVIYNKSAIRKFSDGGKVDDGIIAKINKLDEYEAQGYNVTRLRALKEDMLNFPEKAKLAFEIRDFAKGVWGKELADSFDKRPLGSLMQFFYTNEKSVKEHVDNQILAANNDIASNERYIDSLGKSKSDQKSREFSLSSIKSAEDRIEKLKSAYVDYVNAGGKYEAGGDIINFDAIRENLLDDEGYDTWMEFIDNQKNGECQGIASSVELIYPEAKRVFGEIEVDEPYIDEDGEEQTLVTHHWNEINGEIYDFSKGTLKDYITWNDLYSVDTAGEEWRYDAISSHEAGGQLKPPSIEVYRRSMLPDISIKEGYYNYNSIGKTFFEKESQVINSWKRAVKANPELSFKIIKVPAEGHYIEIYQLMYKAKKELGGSAAANHAITDSPKFISWFDDSKITDSAGKPLVVWHGTTHKINQFKPTVTKRIIDGHIQDVETQNYFFTSNKAVAEIFAEDKRKIDLEYHKKKSDKIVTGYFLSIKNPLDFTMSSSDAQIKVIQKYGNIYNLSAPNPFAVEAFYDITGYDVNDFVDVQQYLDDESIVLLLKENGYDGVILEELDYEGTTYVAFYPEQIKLADGTNKTFDGNNPDVRFTEGGSVKMFELSDIGLTEQQKEDGGYVSNRCTNKVFEAITGVCIEENLTYGMSLLEKLGEFGYKYEVNTPYSDELNSKYRNKPLRLFVENEKPGVFYIVTSGHAVAYVNGKLTDTYGGLNKKILSVFPIHKVERVADSQKNSKFIQNTNNEIRDNIRGKGDNSDGNISQAGSGYIRGNVGAGSEDREENGREPKFEHGGKAWKPQPGTRIQGRHTFYRVDTGYSHAKETTAKDVIDFEDDEHGNTEEMVGARLIAQKHGIDLTQISAKELIWVTITKTAAKRYGSNVEDYPIDNALILAYDGDGGYLVLKNSDLYIQELAEGGKIENVKQISLEDAIKMTSTEDVNAVGGWLLSTAKTPRESVNISLNNIVFYFKEEPMEIFSKQISEMEDSYNNFPKEEKRTKMIYGIIKNNGEAKPVFVELNDKNKFILEGRHRIVAFKMAGLKTVPVIYVVKKTATKETGGEVSGNTLSNSIWIRDTLIDKDYFNSLPENKRTAIFALVNEFNKLGYIDSRTQLGPNQSARMSDRERERFSNTALEAFRIEDKIKELLKPDAQVSKEADAAKIEKAKSRKSQLDRQIKDLETIFPHKINSARSNATKVAYEKAKAELVEVNAIIGSGAKLESGGKVQSNGLLYNGIRVPETVSTDMLISAFTNPIDDEKLSRFTEEMKSQMLSHEFPPIDGYPRILNKDDIGTEFMNGDVVTKEHVDKMAWMVWEGHHRSLAAIAAGLPYVEVELNPNAITDEGELVAYKKWAAGGNRKVVEPEEKVSPVKIKKTGIKYEDEWTKAQRSNGWRIIDEFNGYKSGDILKDGNQILEIYHYPNGLVQFNMMINGVSDRYYSSKLFFDKDGKRNYGDGGTIEPIYFSRDNSTWKTMRECNDYVKSHYKESQANNKWLITHKPSGRVFGPVYDFDKSQIPGRGMPNMAQTQTSPNFIKNILAKEKAVICLVKEFILQET